MLSTVVLCACGPTPAPPVAPERPVLVAQATRPSLGGLDFVGQVRAVRRAELAFAVQGVVREVLVEPGMAVRQGQLLARLDDRPLAAQLGAGQAELQRLQAAQTEVQRRHQRLRQAHEAGAASDAEWTAVQAELQAAAAAVDAARAQRANAAWASEQTLLRAPFDGRIGLRQLEVGQVAGAGVTVVAVDGPGREVWASVPSSLGLQAGQMVKLRGSAGTADGRVLQVGERLEAGGARRVLLSAPAHWAVGDAVVVSFQTIGGQAAPLQIPLRAVLPSSAQAQAQAKAQVLRLDAAGRHLEQAAVTLGSTRGDQIEVLSGLREGDRVVVAGGQVLSAGEAVQPVERLR